MNLMTLRLQTNLCLLLIQRLFMREERCSHCKNKVKNHKSSSRALGVCFVFADVTHSCWNNAPSFFIANTEGKKKKNSFWEFKYGARTATACTVQSVYGSVVPSLYCPYHTWLVPWLFFCWSRVLGVFFQSNTRNNVRSVPQSTKLRIQELLGQ